MTGRAALRSGTRLGHLELESHLPKKNSRADTLAADQALIDGTTKNLSKLPASFPVGSQQMTPQDVINVVQGRVTTGKAVVAAEKARTEAVQADRDERAKTQLVVGAYKRLVVAMFLKSPTILGDFGLAAPKQAAKTAEEKAQAAAKAQATRKTLGTKGTQQKKAAKAAAAAAPEAPAQPSTPAAQPAPAAKSGS
jgi:hypothetical protein